MKKLIIAVVAVSTVLLSGCAFHPEQMSDTQLCAEYGHSQATGNANRQSVVMSELQRRDTMHTISIDVDTCKSFAQTGANQAQVEAQQAAAWNQIYQAQMMANAIQNQNINVNHSGSINVW